MGDGQTKSTDAERHVKRKSCELDFDTLDCLVCLEHLSPPVYQVCKHILSLFNECVTLFRASEYRHAIILLFFFSFSYTKYVLVRTLMRAFFLGLWFRV